jgi:pimeloyl-ACP methyl ester carboxylesterase
MASSALGLFVPGFGAPARAYAPGLPAGWEALEPPAFRRVRGSFEAYRAWLRAEISAAGDAVVLAGHSMGGALSVLAALDEPERVRGLVLFSPAGLPLTKPMRISAAQFAGQVATRRFPVRHSGTALADLARAPCSALRVAHAVRRLDLELEMRRVAVAGVPAAVVGCTTDTLVTAGHCRQAAALLGARYRELPLEGGHMWMFRRPWRLARELTAFAG